MYEEREERERDGKEWEEGFGEKWRRDPVDAVAWASVFIWAGLVLLVDNLGLLARFEWLEAWGLIFIGAGLIVLVEVVVRLLIPSYRHPVTGHLILAVILLAIGLGDLVGWGAIWPLVLIVIGLAIIVGGLTRTRRP